MLTMKDIVREGHPALREVAQAFDLPLQAADLELAEEMMTFLENSQDEEIAAKYELRAGVGLAAPQLGITKQLIAVLVPGEYEDDAPLLKTVMFNPKIVRHSVKQTCLKDGEGCLSVDRPVEGVVPRHHRITVSYIDVDGNQQEQRFEGFIAIVLQHEIDHLNGIMFYDRIDEKNPLDTGDMVVI